MAASTSFSTYSTNGQPRSLAVARSKSDAAPAIAVAEGNVNLISAFKVGALRTWSITAKLKTGNNPVSVASADLNNDGHADLVCANQDDNTVSVFIGDGAGAFIPASGSPYPAGTGPDSAAVADLNSDGIPDIVVADGAGNAVTVLMGKGDGTFWAGKSYPTGLDPVSVACADANGDGALDIITANYSTNTITVLINNGFGAFATKADYPTGQNPVGLAVGDFNGDNHPDIAVAGPGGQVYVHLNNGTGAFDSYTPYNTDFDSTAITVSDINKDGKDDIITANSGTSDSVSVLLGNGDGTFKPQESFTTGAATGPSGVAVADLNGDGVPDIVTPDLSDSTVAILYGKFIYHLQTAASPDYAGSVMPASGDYDAGTPVTLSCSANTSYFLASWSGDKLSSTNPPTVTMDADKTVTADFVQGYTLTATALQPGCGSFQITPSGTNGYYAPGSQVQVTAIPAPGYTFTGFAVTGGMGGTPLYTVSGDTVNLTMNQNITVNANFVLSDGITMRGYLLNGATVTITTCMYKSGSPASGKTITFYENTGTGSFMSKGTAVTDSNGVAAKTFTSTAGTHTAYAYFAASGGMPMMKSGNVSYYIGQVVPVSPANAAALTSAGTPVPSWQAYTGAAVDMYHLQVSTSSTFPATGLESYATTDTSYALPARTPGKTYYWRVYADIEPSGSKTMMSAVRSFTYRNATNITASLIKQSGLNVTLKAALANPGGAMYGKTVSFYDGTTLKASGTTLADGTVTKTFASTVSAAPHSFIAKYAGDAVNAPSASATLPVTVAKVMLDQPANAAVVTTLAPALSWQAYTGSSVVKYHAQVSTSSTFPAGFESYSTTGVSVQIPARTLGKTYYWRAYADILPAGSMTAMSDTRSFTFKAPTGISLQVSLSGSTVTAKATLTRTDTSQPLAGKTITFFENTSGGSYSNKGTAATGSTSPNLGVAQKIWTTSAGTHNAYATFAGDSMYAPSGTNPADVSY